MSTSSFFNTAPQGSSETSVTGEAVLQPAGTPAEASAKSSFYSGTGPSTSQTSAIEGAVAQTAAAALQALAASAAAIEATSDLDMTDVVGLGSALAGKVDDIQVLTDVPTNALFTDTTYSNVSAFSNDLNYLTPSSGIDAGNF